MFERIQKIISQQLNVPIEKVTPEARFIEDFSADSLDMIELITQIESEFGISITDEQIATMQTVQGVVDFCSKLAGK